MLSGGDNFICSAGKSFEHDEVAASACKNELEKKWGKPHLMEKKCVGASPGGCWLAVSEFYDCKANAEFLELGSTRSAIRHYAKSCAESLSKITGQPHKASMIRHSTVWGDIWQVVKK